MHEGPVAERFPLNPKASGAKRPQTDIDPDDAIFGDQYRRQPHGTRARRHAQIAHQPTAEAARRSAGRGETCSAQRQRGATCVHDVILSLARHENAVRARVNAGLPFCRFALK
jgi:hypothetical protein